MSVIVQATVLPKTKRPKRLDVICILPILIFFPLQFIYTLVYLSPSELSSASEGRDFGPLSIINFFLSVQNKALLAGTLNNCCTNKRIPSHLFQEETMFKERG